MKTQKFRKTLVLNKQTISNIDAVKSQEIKGGLSISCLACIVTKITAGDCDVWSFGETDCPITPLRDTGRA